MLVYDELLNNYINRSESAKIIVNVVDDTIIFGYTFRRNCIGYKLIQVIFHNEVYFAIKQNIINYIFFDGTNGYYRINIKNEISKEHVLALQYTKASGKFPYVFKKNYEAIESFDLFRDKQKIISHNRNYPLGKELFYTFGLEFETASGYIPEDICFRDGLIPLRDGSISGLEYSTVVMSGTKGIALLRQQLATLRRYTIYDKECALHIHLGGFPLNKDNIFALYKLCTRLDFYDMVPQWTFRTSKYKASGKDYCTLLPEFKTFEEMYREFSGGILDYIGSLTMNHPMDKSRERKWNIPYRYYWVNFINILFFKVNKTIEFRFLRPSFNFEKIQLWLYIFNALLKYAENNTDEIIKPDWDYYPRISEILREIYEEPLFEKLQDKVILLRRVVDCQTSVKDFWGGRTDIDDQYFGYNTVL